MTDKAEWLVQIDVWQIAAGLIAVIPAVLITALVYIASIETIIKCDLDFDEELRRIGLGMCATSCVGGFAGFHSASATTLNWRRTEGDPRVAIIAAGIVCGLSVIGAQYIAALPTPLLAGLLFAIGGAMLRDWLLEVGRIVDVRERAIAWAMMALTLGIGFLPALSLGLLAGSALFIRSYGRIPVVRNYLSVADLRSGVERSIDDEAILGTHGRQARILTLQGYLFFATAHPVYETVRQTIQIHAPRFLILDFRDVPGADASAAQSFEKVIRAAQRFGVELHVSHLSSDTRRVLERVFNASKTPIHETLDSALEKTEERIINGWKCRDERSFEISDLTSITRVTDRRILRDGEVFARTGEPANALVFVLTGQVEAFTHLPGRKPIRLRAMLPGTVAGEIGFFSAGVRTADLRAKGPTTVLFLTRAAYERLLQTEPEIAAGILNLVVRRLSRRLVDRDRLVRTLLS